MKRKALTAILNWYFLLISASDVSTTHNLGKATNHTWTGLSLHPGTRYYITVTAVNTLGASTTHSSDGFVIDTARPITGIVFNTKTYKNHLFQSQTDYLGVSWHGFTDMHSYIQHYQVAILTPDDTVYLPYQAVGRKTRVTLSGLDLQSGMIYKAAVKAVDASGKVSDEVISHPVLIDSSPPLAYQCNTFNQILKETQERNVDESYITWSKVLIVNSNVYQLEIDVPGVTDKTNVIVKIGEHSFQANLVRHHFSHSFALQPNKRLSISVTVSDIENAGNITVVLLGCNDLTLQTYSSHRIPLRQKAYSSMYASLQFIDNESGIREVQFGVGTTVHGYQVCDLEPVSTGGYHTWPVHVPHGTPVYATAVVENNAGLLSYFRSDPLIIDHTPPTIADARLQYGVTDGMVTLTVTWNVDEKEGDQMHFILCGVAIGMRKLFFNCTSIFLTKMCITTGTCYSYIRNYLKICKMRIITKNRHDSCHI